MFYRIDKENNIIDSADFKYADDCLETNKNIIRGFNGQLVFEEDTQSQPYLEVKQEFENKLLRQKQIEEIKQNLSNTDYQAIKYAEGELTEEEYAPIKAQRKVWREEINRLEELGNGK